MCHHWNIFYGTASVMSYPKNIFILMFYKEYFENFLNIQLAEETKNKCKYFVTST